MQNIFESVTNRKMRAMMECLFKQYEESHNMSIIKRATLCSKKVEYTVKKHRKAKRLKLAIYCDGSCVVTAPWWISMEKVDKFVRQNAEWVIEKMRKMKRIGRQSVFATSNREEYLKLRETARELVRKRLEKYNEYYNFDYKRVAIRDTKTRWASCSSKGNLNFSYKILFLPLRYADYIIVHELCHLKEFNHSKRFWNLVAEMIPEHERIREKLKAM
jgi:predicted metal-dependent hydrolase